MVDLNLLLESLHVSRPNATVFPNSFNFKFSLEVDFLARQMFAEQEGYYIIDELAVVPLTKPKD